jgi:hypothetical protein
MLHKHHFVHDHTKPRLQTCERCHRPFVLIEYHDKVLKGCVGCNLWGRIGGRAWTHLPSHDLRVLESMLRDMTRTETEPAA